MFFSVNIYRNHKNYSRKHDIFRHLFYQFFFKYTIFIYLNVFIKSETQIYILTFYPIHSKYEYSTFSAISTQNHSLYLSTYQSYLCTFTQKLTMNGFVDIRHIIASCQILCQPIMPFSISNLHSLLRIFTALILNNVFVFYYAFSIIIEGISNLQTKHLC